MDNSSSAPGSAISATEHSSGFIRTVLGDLPATAALGVCDSNDHVAMQGEWLADNFPESVLADPERTLVDLRGFRAARGGWIVDSTPTGPSRDAALLKRLATNSQISIVCPTGVQQSRFYPPRHPLLGMQRDQLVELFVREITTAVDDGAGPLAIQAGVIVVASDATRLTSREKERFVAAALAQQQTGCPILVHTSGGPEAYEQVAVLVGNGAAPSKVVLTHCDEIGEIKYHRELLAAGVCLVYDRHFRQLSRAKNSVALDMIVRLADEFPRQLLLGMDMTRQKYWRGYGGRPGLAWLLTDFLPMLRRSGVSERQLAAISVENAVRAFAFRTHLHTP